MSILTEKDRDDLCICVTRNQHEIAPSSACPLLIAGKAVERIIARHLGVPDTKGEWLVRADDRARPMTVDLCRHCGRPPEADGDHSCPCPYSDADCPDHPRSPR